MLPPGADTVDVFVKTVAGKTILLPVRTYGTVDEVKYQLWEKECVPPQYQRIVFDGKILQNRKRLSDYHVRKESTLRMVMCLDGGIDFQNRAGSKPGSGGVMSAEQANIDRRERLRKLALETIDLSKDPYFMRNHLGSYECKLCLTLHNNEGNYLAHTQGKRHQTNLARRAAKEAAESQIAPNLTAKVQVRKTIKIGRPGYKVTKSKDPETGARSLLFQIEYPEVSEGFQPRHRFMSAYEQRLEAPNKDYQYILFACEPYETIGFKVPNMDIDKSEGRFFTNWDRQNRTFTLQVYFLPDKNDKPNPPPPPSRKMYH